MPSDRGAQLVCPSATDELGPLLKLIVNPQTQAEKFTRQSAAVSARQIPLSLDLEAWRAQPHRVNGGRLGPEPRPPMTAA